MPRAKLPDPQKTCEKCGETITRKTYRGRMEDRGVFLRRRFCDLRCAWEAQRVEVPSLSTLRSRNPPLRKPSCQECGSTHLVSLHHIDGDPANNARANTMTLCGSCHTKWHWRHGKRPNPKKATTCFVCGRAEPRIKRGMCGMHYQRWRTANAATFPQRMTA